MAASARNGRSNLRLLLIALPVLLVVAVVVNLKTITEITKGERSLKSVIYGISEGGGGEFQGMDIPGNIGDPEAKVTLEAFVRRGADCHANTVFMAEALGAIDPKRIKIVFQDTSTPEGLKRHQAVKLGCDQGMAVNGKVQFKDSGGANGKPKGQPGTKPGTVMLTGGHQMHWTPTQLYKILDAELKAAYKGKGMQMTSEQFETKLAAEQTAAQERTAAKMAAKAEAAKAAKDAK